MKYLEGKEKVPDTGFLHFLPYFFILAANVLWAVSWVHSNEHNINASQTIIIRGITTLLFNYVICRWKSYNITLKYPE